MTDPVFPPLMSGEATEGDPFVTAIARAGAGCDAGLIVHRLEPSQVAIRSSVVAKAGSAGTISGRPPATSRTARRLMTPDPWTS